jgi:hypothetical protein
MPPFAFMPLSLLLMVSSVHAGTATKMWTCIPYPSVSTDHEDPIEKVEVTLRDTNWSIIHISKLGKHYDRSRQYEIIDTSGLTTFLSWQGNLVGRHNMMMKGDILDTDRGIVYSERLFDQNQAYAQIYSQSFTCKKVEYPETNKIPSAASGPSSERASDRSEAPTLNCASLTDPTKRLACYDREAGVSATAPNPKVGVPTSEPASDSENDTAAATRNNLPLEIYRWAKQYEALVHTMCRHAVVDYSPYGGEVNWLPDYTWNSMVIGKGRILITGKDIQLKNRYGTNENVVYDCAADLKSLPKTNGGALEGYEPKAGDGERPDDWVIDPHEISAHPPWWLNRDIDLLAPDFKLQMQWGGVY